MRRRATAVSLLDKNWRVLARFQRVAVLQPKLVKKHSEEQYVSAGWWNPEEIISRSSDSERLVKFDWVH